MNDSCDESRREIPVSMFKNSDSYVHASPGGRAKNALVKSETHLNNVPSLIKRSVETVCTQINYGACFLF